MQTYYEAADFFLTRAAFLPCGEREDSSEALLCFYRRNTLFQEAIAIASPSLHASLQNCLAGREEWTKLYPSLLKYYLRMRSRATPFGLFSGVAWGEFQEKSALTFSLSSVEKRVKPDGEWVRWAIDRIHSQIDQVRALRVMTNPNLIKREGRVFLNAHKEGAIDSISIKSSVVSDTLFSHAKQPIHYAELENWLFTKFNQQEKEKISAYLWQIFQKGYLLSELHGASWDALALVEGMSKTAACLNKYQSAGLGEGLSQLKEASAELQAHKPMQHLLHIDAYRKGAFHLPRQMKERIEETVSVLWLLTQEELEDLSFYRNRFEEKYGHHRLVPLLELIDPHRGLGLPSFASSSEKGSSWWKEAVFSSLGKQPLEIESLLPSAPSPEKLQKAPLSFELYFELLADSEQDLDDGNYTLLLNPFAGSLQAGSTFGRFLSLFSSSQTGKLKDFLKKEEALLPQSVFVEASFLPDQPRIANVALHERTRESQLQMEFHEPSMSQVELEDIYVGAKPGGLYLYSRRLGKELYFTLGSAINRDLAPPILQLILRISRAPFTLFSPYLWKGAQNIPFLPRVSYKNVILSPARWMFDPSLLKIGENASAAEIEKALERALAASDLPETVHLALLDHHILLNWKDKDHFRLIVQHFVAKRKLHLFEAFGKATPLLSEAGKHVAEFVVPCVKKSAYKKEPLPFHYPPCAQINSADRVQAPGGDWLYAKLFVAGESQESFLKNQIGPSIQRFVEAHWIDRWCYVRYEEEKPHLRLRMHGRSPSLCEKVIPALNGIASEWMGQGLLRDISFHTYEREIERYGGPEAIDLAEQLFQIDSECCLAFLEKISDFPFSLSAVGALGAIHLAQGFYSSSAELALFFSPHFRHRHLLSGFRQESAKFIPFALSLFSDLPSEEEPVQWARSLYSPLRIASQRLNRAISDSIWSAKESTLLSLIHMHCNRLLGIDPEGEKRAMVIACQLLEKMEYKRKSAYETGT